MRYKLTISTRVILGIDPGTVTMGYGAVRVQGSNIELLGCGAVRLNNITPPLRRLGVIFEKTNGLIARYKPAEVAVESAFFGKNVQSMLKLGRAQGVVITAAQLKGLPVFEYAPKRIKQSVTGRGNATKEQVAAMLRRLVGFTESPRYLDATDGLAVAVCHSMKNISPGGEKKYSGWKAFLEKNPGRVRSGG